jgi:hypothetical protein
MVLVKAGCLGYVVGLVGVSFCRCMHVPTNSIMDVKLTRLPSLLPVHTIFWMSGRFVLLHPLDVEHRGAGPLV